MHRHKSLGLLSGMIVLPRVAYRLGNMAAVRTYVIMYIISCPGFVLVVVDFSFSHGRQGGPRGIFGATTFIGIRKSISSENALFLLLLLVLFAV